MPEKVIPCTDCEIEKKKIEEAGDCKVIECTKIEDRPGWCKIVWRYK